MEKEKIEKGLINILERIDKSEDIPEKIFPILYELSLLFDNESGTKELALDARGFEELVTRVFDKVDKYVFLSSEWINYKKKREKLNK